MHNTAHAEGNTPRPSTGGPSGLHMPLRSAMTMHGDAVSGYGLHASGSAGFPSVARERTGNLAGVAPNGGSSVSDPLRGGSLRADIARYNAERAGHAVSPQSRMEVPRPPFTYSSNLYTN